MKVYILVSDVYGVDTTAYLTRKEAEEAQKANPWYGTNDLNRWPSVVTVQVKGVEA